MEIQSTAQEYFEGVINKSNMKELDDIEIQIKETLLN
jgi:hypothetical protein